VDRAAMVVDLLIEITGPLLATKAVSAPEFDRFYRALLARREAFRGAA
jgi:hypothetical protein